MKENLSAISVRDQNSYDIVEHLTGIKSEIHLESHNLLYLALIPNSALIAINYHIRATRLHTPSLYFICSNRQKLDFLLDQLGLCERKVLAGNQSMICSVLERPVDYIRVEQTLGRCVMTEKIVP